jgi:MYXO-CTERM domain-containing protein
MATTIRPRGLAERAGKVYAATDDQADGQALAVSADRGETWRRVMGLMDIGSITSCGSLPGVCLGVCTVLRESGLVRPTLCGAPRPDAADAAAATDGGGGCSCRTGARGSGAAALVTAGLALLLARRRRW